MKLLILFFIFFALTIAVQGNSFVKTDYTELDSILNEATYYSVDKTYGTSEKERVQNRLNEIRENFTQTKGVLQNIDVLQSTENYTIFIDNTNKQAYLTIRGTVPTKGSDLKNDAQMFFNSTPERVQQINELMSGKMTELSNQGYLVNVSGHSLGGSLALFACADNSWVNHCEVHNPYLDNTIVNKLNPIFNSNGMNTKVVIQETLNDFVSQHFPTTYLNVTYSVFELVSNVNGIGEHSSLGLFAKSFLEGGKQINFEYPLNTSQEFADFVENCKHKFEEFINLISSCKENQYYNFSSLACIACPVSQSCRDNFLGPYNCPPSQIATGQGQCQACSAGTYVSEVGKNVCFKCPVGHKCVGGIKTPCPPGTYTNYMKDTECYPCKEGYYQLQSGSTGCEFCPKGHKCPSTTSPPIPCEPGTYQIFTTQTFCRSCDEGYYQVQSGSTGCEFCPKGHKCPSTTSLPIPCEPGTYQIFTTQTFCRSCDEGYYQVQSGSTGCEFCPKGHKCPSTTSLPIPCEPGTKAVFTSQTRCFSCDEGQYQVQSGSSGCENCPLGHKCPSTTLPPIPCEPGSFVLFQNSKVCRPCDKGRYQVQSGSSRCESCPLGHKCPSTTSPPIPCEPGTYSLFLESTECSSCGKGETSNSDRTGCIKVQQGLLQSILLKQNFKQE
ncbi:hypothetical protein ABPG74_015806 [Tetrahymena malaccensis]